MTKEEKLIESQTKTIMELQDKVRTLSFDKTQNGIRIQKLQESIKCTRNAIKKLADQLNAIKLNKNYEDLGTIIEVLTRMGNNDKK